MGDLANASGKESDAIINWWASSGSIGKLFFSLKLESSPPLCYLQRHSMDQGKRLNGSSVSWGWAARSGAGASRPSRLHPSSPTSTSPTTSSSPSGAHLGARLAQDDLEPWDASSHLFVYSLPASQTELFIRMKAGILESNPTDRIWALCFQTHLANISVNAFRKIL